MRTTINLNDNWLFTGFDGVPVPVNVPHTWNAVDGQDGGNDYKRGECKYEKAFAIPAFDPEKECVYLQFDGVNASARVLLNGSEVCVHDGGYSTFRKEVTALLQPENHLTVYVDNSVNDRVYPQKADFTFYGGIYRDVALLIVNKTHFDLDYYGGNGIQIEAKPIEGYQKGNVRIRTWFSSGNAKITLCDAEGKEVASGEGNDVSLTIEDVHLWNGRKDPYLYTAKATLFENGEAADEVSTRFGVRDFHYHAKTGFYLNGKVILCVGYRGIRTAKVSATRSRTRCIKRIWISSAT